MRTTCRRADSLVGARATAVVLAVLMICAGLVVMTGNATAEAATPTPMPSSSAMVKGNPKCSTNTLLVAGCVLGGIVTNRVQDAGDETVNRMLIAPLARLATAAVKTMLTLFLNMWVDFSSFGIHQQGALKLNAITLFIGWLIAAMLLLWQAARTVMMGKPGPLLEALRGLVLTALTSIGGIGVIGLLLAMSDELSRWILGDLSRSDVLNKQMVTMMQRSEVGSVAQAFMTLLIAVLLVLVLLIQLLILILRNSVLPLLALLLPIAAAGQIGGGATRQWLPKIISSVMAVICYKPVVSLIIVAAVAQTRDSTQTPGLIAGVLMFLMSIIAMPALMRVFAPFGVAAAGGGGQVLGTAANLLGDVVQSRGGGGGSPASGTTPTTAADQARRMDQGGPGSSPVPPSGSLSSPTGGSPTAGASAPSPPMGVGVGASGVSSSTSASALSTTAAGATGTASAGAAGTAAASVATGGAALAVQAGASAATGTAKSATEQASPSEAAPAPGTSAAGPPASEGSAAAPSEPPTEAGAHLGTGPGGLTVHDRNYG